MYTKHQTAVCTIRAARDADRNEKGFGIRICMYTRGGQ